MALTKVHNRLIDGSSVNVKDFGAVGDGVTDDSDALEAAFLYAYNNAKSCYLPSGTYRTTRTVELQTATGNESFHLYGDGSRSKSPSKIYMDVDPTDPTKAKMFTSFGGTMKISDIYFQHSDPSSNNSTYIFYTTRDDINTKQDIDWIIEGCTFNSVETVMFTDGRGVTFNNSYFSIIRNCLEIDWPAGFDGTSLLPEQQLTTGMRGYRVVGCNFHASSGGYIIVNTGTNSQNALNFQITDNQIDTPMGILSGSMKNAVVSSNNMQLMNDNHLFLCSSAKLENVTISNNNFQGINTVDLTTYFKTIISASSGTLKNVVFSDNIVSQVDRDLFLADGGTVTNLMIKGNVFDDILKGNDTTQSRHLLSLNGTTVTSVSFIFNQISNFDRTFNEAELLKVDTADLEQLELLGNQRDSTAVPFTQADYKQNNVGKSVFAQISGTGVDPITHYFDSPVQTVFAQSRSTSNGTAQVGMAERGVSTANTGVYVAPDGTYVQLYGVFNTSGSSTMIHAISAS